MMQKDSGKSGTPAKMASSSDSSSGSSVLTNVAPPSALPSFLTSPLPSAVPSTVPPPGPPPPLSTNVPPGQPFPPPGNPPVPPFSSPASTTTSSVPASRANNTQPPGLPPPPGPVPTAGAGSSSISNVPSEGSPFPPSQPNNPDLGSQSYQPPQPYYPPPPDSTSPVTSQPQPPNRQKTHSRHHSYPVYVPGNPMHSPPPPPTPPCLVVQQEQANISLSKSQNHIHSYSVVDPPAESNLYYSDPYFPTRNNVYGYAYAPISEGSTHASASVDLGSPGVVETTKRNEGPGWLGWIRGTVSNVGHRVAERAKTSMDSMITTLDPQMKEFIHSGGDMDIIVASDKEVKVGAIREAFQAMFGKATVNGMKAEAQGIAAQPVGFEAALSSAEGRINFLRSSGKIHPQHPIVAVENFIVEFHSDCWFDLGLLLLDDPGEDILLQTYTQVTPVPPDFVNQARTATPEDYPYKDSGFAVTIGQIASQNLQVHHTMWQEALTGVSRREALLLAGRSLAGLYRSRLPSYH